jgi:hypothetical protein
MTARFLLESTVLRERIFTVLIGRGAAGGEQNVFSILKPAKPEKLL